MESLTVIACQSQANGHDRRDPLDWGRGPIAKAADPGNVFKDILITFLWHFAASRIGTYLFVPGS